MIAADCIDRARALVARLFSPDEVETTPPLDCQRMLRPNMCDVVEVRRQMEAGIPFHEIEDRLDSAENRE